MCGILGFSASTFTPDLDHRFRAALGSLQHRGPDDQGVEIFSLAGRKLVLGHTRLSIIDLSPGGHQPMHSADGRHTIVFNGEIYNYRELRSELISLGHVFLTDSDTEVLLAAWAQWGSEGLRRLTGMFAFSVFDHIAKTLTLVRDAFGIKPLFYRLDEDSVSFASELPALLKLFPNKPSINMQSAYDYLVWGRYDDHAATFYEGILHLMPGHFLTLYLDQQVQSDPLRWWWPSIEECSDLSFEQAADQLREIFLESVRLHLRSDVPLGAALSGGIDSSAVVCVMRHLEPDMPIHTFSYVARGSKVDEERWANLINAHVGAIDHKVALQANDLVDDLSGMINAQGEPFGGTSIYAQFRVFRLASDNGITVTLDGQGADELLAGYVGYPEMRILSYLDSSQYKEALRFSQHWCQRTGGNHFTLWKSVLSQSLPSSFRKKLKACSSFYVAPDWIDKEFISELNIRQAPSDLSIPFQLNGRRLAGQLANELVVQRIPRLLRYADRNSMHFSVESRVPFLTTRMAEFLLTLPEHYLVSREGESKRIFRRAMRGLVPDVVLDRRDKIGFDTPQSVLMAKLKPVVHKISISMKNIPLVNNKEVMRKYGIGSGNGIFNAPSDWRLVNYLVWASNYKNTL